MSRNECSGSTSLYHSIEPVSPDGGHDDDAKLEGMQQSNSDEWRASVSKFLGLNLDDDGNDDDDDSSTRPSTLFSLAHVRQQECWDCGVACLQMVSLWLNDEKVASEEERLWILESVATESIWTVDLMLLLEKIMECNAERCKGRFLFSSKCLSVNPDLGTLDYYNAAFSEDIIRVQEAFRKIEDEDLPTVQMEKLSLYSVLQLIRRPDCLAIALVDNSVLRGSPPGSKPYAGHYIILTGTSSKEEDLSAAQETSHGFCLTTFNPAVDGGKQICISLDLFETAWRTEGTDEDIIFVSKKSA